MNDNNVHVFDLEVTLNLEGKSFCSSRDGSREACTNPPKGWGLISAIFLQKLHGIDKKDGSTGGGVYPWCPLEPVL